MTTDRLNLIVIPEFGSAYALIEGELTQIPMNADGTLVPLEGSATVDFDNIPLDESLRLHTVAAHLESLNELFPVAS